MTSSGVLASMRANDSPITPPPDDADAVGVLTPCEEVFGVVHLLGQPDQVHAVVEGRRTSAPPGHEQGLVPHHRPDEHAVGERELRQRLVQHAALFAELDLDELEAVVGEIDDVQCTVGLRDLRDLLRQEDPEG